MSYSRFLPAPHLLKGNSNLPHRLVGMTRRSTYQPGTHGCLSVKGTERWGRPARNSGRHNLGWRRDNKVIVRVLSFLKFCLQCTACGILVLWPGIKPTPSALGVQQSLNHWTAGEVLIFLSKTSNHVGSELAEWKRKNSSLSSLITRQSPCIQWETKGKTQQRKSFKVIRR